MSKYLSPFVFNGRWFVRPYEQQLDGQGLRETLDALIERFEPGDILVLRPMSKEEVDLLEEYRENYDAEVLAQVIAKYESARNKKPRS